MFQVVLTSMVLVACEPVRDKPVKIAFGEVKAPVRVPPERLRLPEAVPVKAPTNVVAVTLVSPVIVAGSESVGVVVPVTVIWLAVPVMLVTPPLIVVEPPRLTAVPLMVMLLLARALLGMADRRAVGTVPDVRRAAEMPPPLSVSTIIRPVAWGNSHW